MLIWMKRYDLIIQINIVSPQPQRRGDGYSLPFLRATNRGVLPCLFVGQSALVVRLFSDSWSICPSVLSVCLCLSARLAMQSLPCYAFIHPSVLLLSSFCPPSVLLLSSFCPSVLLLSSFCPPFVLLLSFFCPPSVLLLSLLLSLSLILSFVTVLLDPSLSFAVFFFFVLFLLCLSVCPPLLFCYFILFWVLVRPSVRPFVFLIPSSWPSWYSRPSPRPPYSLSFFHSLRTMGPDQRRFLSTNSKQTGWNA